MTTIAWDGRRKTLAADKRATSGTVVRTVTKIHRIGSDLVGISGNLAHGMALLDWARAGYVAKEFPSPSKGDDDAYLVRVTRDAEVFRYEGPHAFKVEDEFFTTGSGSDYAMAALHMGLTARQAIELASRLEPGTGNGVDVLEL
ncbi:hypothetical protein [Piscinibacter gummiphilus]|uniref:Uncharacterized protein n=1 Tax=Piscinibacter gummiphilus TaxID=946333 RepID=A0ABZ0CUF5_9BURK|nr:hypothetical protein [Piscinibacter gummiphilus]WOB06523.1 hypothetical protein RXV79_16495 [Piscinibacter gummiphilus]